MMEVFREQKLLTKEFKPVANAEETLRNKIVGLFFSASWSIPCHDFIQTLVEFHKETENRQYQFQIVYVPFDKTEEAMKKYVQNEHGNWLLVPFDDPMIRTLREQYSVNMVPKLVIVKPNGDLLTERGRKEVADRGVTAYRTWSMSVFGVQNSKAAVLQSIEAKLADSASRKLQTEKEVSEERDSGESDLKVTESS